MFLLNAFISRRVFLIANSVGDAVLIGSSHSSDTMRLRECYSPVTTILTPIWMWSRSDGKRNTRTFRGFRQRIYLF